MIEKFKISFDTGPRQHVPQREGADILFGGASALRASGMQVWQTLKCMDPNGDLDCASSGGPAHRQLQRISADDRMRELRSLHPRRGGCANWVADLIWTQTKGAE
ncbi:uncharacterized protein VTP21DRAFT_11293 [Calcarisporiella thermophila]|uniref:uncharacterized protein n=1 Tax=Calcarisporiella thermophila TaxID=911321 RepID=UPI0037420B9F